MTKQDGVIRFVRGAQFGSTYPYVNALLQLKLSAERSCTYRLSHQDLVTVQKIVYWSVIDPVTRR